MALHLSNVHQRLPPSRHSIQENSEDLLQGPHMVLDNGCLWSAQHLLLSIMLLVM
ncbi:hypothetical protein K503DRAFT_774477 [Rhizopogon vinicolor AM-OR11-026]|uniref:Uncharacterized protein n=1 Tax=Rhizopogon vinicolor AM-OR11-026 TaxID=1314800 RepID=A0A1B7MPG7_9AGAM|nr:hypothetical protein K503DRAFT_774477 [Rhizopogon vinicolor AM-OR11-026]